MDKRIICEEPEGGTQRTLIKDLETIKEVIFHIEQILDVFLGPDAESISKPSDKGESNLMAAMEISVDNIKNRLYHVRHKLDMMKGRIE